MLLAYFNIKQSLQVKSQINILTETFKSIDIVSTHVTVFELFKHCGEGTVWQR